MTRPSPQQTARTERLIMTVVYGFLAVLVAVGIYAIATNAGSESVFDDSLPNPMGGPARSAPGTAEGTETLGQLTVDDVRVSMGTIANGITYVPAWDVANPTGEQLNVKIGMPQVLDGCCPGPVYVDGELTQPGEEVTVPAAGSVHLQFPLQMHTGMDGPHHLTVPLQSDGQRADLEVTGDFQPDASATG